MRRFLHKILSILMAFVVLFTTLSFTVDMHYCGDSLVDFSFFTKAKTCGMEKAQPSKGCENPTLSKKSCCSNQKILKEASDDLKTSFDKLNFEQQTFVATFFFSYINLFEGLGDKVIPTKDYSPPFIERDVQILYETYLI
ncbi:hypothetical protein FBT53_06470 [Flavobacterium sp. ASW18X]|nr:hypothetical protein [Flavobacterium sp. ASW18X]TKD65168.1 hypothetical protein FBT53_06470 [Flavobacterium sp. ASW18X]